MPPKRGTTKMSSPAKSAAKKKTTAKVAGQKRKGSSVAKLRGAQPPKMSKKTQVESDGPPEATTSKSRKPPKMSKKTQVESDGPPKATTSKSRKPPKMSKKTQVESDGPPNKATTSKSRKPTVKDGTPAATVKASSLRVRQKRNIDAAAQGEKVVVKRKRKEKFPSYAALPPEVMLRVFSYLGKKDLMLGGALTCKRWCEVAFDSELWQDVTLSGRKLTVKRATQLVRRMTKLKKLRLVGWEDNHRTIDPILNAVEKGAKELEALLLESTCWTSGYTLAFTMLSCSEIKELHISSLPNVSDRHPLDRLPLEWSVEKFTLSWNYHYSKPPNVSAQRKWDSLREVSILQPYSDIELEVIVASSRGQLRKLMVDNLKKPESYLGLSRCELLEELHFNSALNMTDSGLLDGVGRLTNLQHLTLRYNKNVSSYALTAFLSCQNVVGKLVTLELSLFAMGPQLLPIISSKCPLLTSLTIKYCKAITIESLQALVLKRPIKHLDVTGCFEADEIKDVIELVTVIRPTLTMIG